ncbi:MAG: DUF1501 domain-containing protein [Bacteroidetes bacterium]|nr:DUF1501 domain-containing protein [Bacteroidota bacterium]
MKRKEFLKNVAAGVVLPSFLNGISLKALAGTSTFHALSRLMGEDKVLVLIQLAGGNDGLNTVIPVDQYSAYSAARENIAIPENKALKLQGVEGTALHPSLTGFQQLFNEGKLGIIQAVSYPKPNFSHFRATDIWMTASDSNMVLNTGWAGRTLDHLFPQFPAHYPNATMPDPLAIQVGSVVSSTFQGPSFTMGIAISNTSKFYNLIEGKTDVESDSRWGEQINYIEEMSLKTDQYANVIKQAALKVTAQSDQYPAAGKNGLADQLKIVARLIGGGLKTKIYMVNMGSFDTHSKQTEDTDKTSGNHSSLLKKLSEAVTAFMADLEYLQVKDKVMGITFSEFGRRIKSNASGGTDHGAAAPMFYFGHTVKSGIIGNNPVLPANATVQDNVAMQHDFRAVYSSILQNWMGLSPDEAGAILPGQYPLIPVV